MVAITTKNIRINSAEQFLESVSEPASTILYLSYGKNTPWPIDTTPNTTIDCVSHRNEVWKNLIAGKRITGNDITLAIKRVDWSANTKYDQYDDLANTLYNDNTNFYVLTDDYNVYKCLSNNNGANSTFKPTYTSFATNSNEADGYVWKYMYTLNTKEIQRFLSTSWMPVKTLTTNDGSAQWYIQTSAIDGAIDVIAVSNGGINYTNSSNITITISGDGSGASAIASINAISNVVSNVTVTSRGSGYTYATAILTGGGGSGANLRPIIGPYGGHGKNPVYELGGSNILIDALIKGTENGKLVANNDYRQISIIKDPISYGSSNTFSNSIFNQTLSLSISAGGGGSEYIVDEYVYQGASLSTSTFSGRVFNWDSANNILRLTEYTGNPTSTTLNGQTSGSNRFITSVINPDLKNRSGEVIYMDNIQPVTRTVDQTENIKIVIKF